MNLVESWAAHYEETSPEPQTIIYDPKLLKAIVGFSIDITRIEAKYKLSQNRSTVERQKIIGSLSQSGLDNVRGVAELMKEL